MPMMCRQRFEVQERASTPERMIDLIVQPVSMTWLGEFPEWQILVVITLWRAGLKRTSRDKHTYSAGSMCGMTR